MALTASTMLDLGTNAPDFTLPDVCSNEQRSLQSVKGAKGTLVMFICRHCPYVVYIQDELGRMGNEYHEKGFGVVAISANSVASHPEDGPQHLAAMVRELNYQFPYLYDESQAVAKAYTAACTPDFFLFNANLKLVYRGQMDNARPGNSEPNDGSDLRTAMDALIVGAVVGEDQKPSLGCNIKWIPGQEPDYFG